MASTNGDNISKVETQNESLIPCIEELKAVVRKHNLTPARYRYATKRVREQLKLFTVRQSKSLPDYLTPAEAHMLRDHAYKQSNETGVLVKFLIFTGLRISEARNLQIQHVDFDSAQLKVVAGKGSKDRHVPIAVSLSDSLRQHIANRTKGYVFCKRNETPYTIRALQYKVENVIRALNSPKSLSTHSLRHTFACLCLSRGLSLEQIQLLMGHSHKQTTEIYAKLELGAVKEQFLQLMGN